MRKQYYFDTNDILVEHLLAVYPKPEDLGTLRLNILLYFIFSRYAGFFNPELNDGVCEDNFDYAPTFISPLEFVANTYGPLEKTVCDKMKNNEYTPQEYLFPIDNLSQSIKSLIDQTIEIVSNKNIFSLVDRTHGDNGWFNAYQKGLYSIIDTKDIINDYSLNNLIKRKKD